MVKKEGMNSYLPDKRHCLYGALWLVLHTAGAQSLPNGNPFPGQPFTTAAQQQLEALRARTSPDYFHKLFMPERKVSGGAFRYARVQSDCEESYLCSARPLPVQLSTFTGKRLENFVVSLTWETSD